MQSDYENILQVDGLSKYFGGLAAVSNCFIKIKKGSITGIIGPNGSGKTTLVSLICGRTAPSSGRISFKGKDITGLSSAKRVQSGIVYTFQVTSVFSNLNCYENVALSVQRTLRSQSEGKMLLGKWSMVSETDIEQEVAKYLQKVGLEGVETQIAGTLPYGHLKLLEVAMGLAAGPKLLILDEPTQGLAEAEIENLTQLIREISKTVNVLLIEHNMEVVFNLAEHVTVMDNGSILAEGTPAEIENNHDVQASYLGS